jgi:hypothetical protein
MEQPPESDPICSKDEDDIRLQLAIVRIVQFDHRLA